MSGLGTSDPFGTFIGSVVFWIAAVASVFSAYLIVAQVRNLVRAALALIVTLGAVAAIYAIMAADFLAIIQLVVYVGAIMVLIIFSIMMTPGQIDLPGMVGRGQQFGAALVAAVVLLASGFVIVQTPWNVRAAPLDIGSTVGPIGGLLMTRYVLPFEIASVLLTVALIGAIVIARED